MLPEKADTTEAVEQIDFSIALICTTRPRIPASASANQGPKKGDLIPLGGLVASQE